MVYPVPESHGYIMSDTERPDNSLDVIWDPLLGEFMKTKDTVLILRERCCTDALKREISRENSLRLAPPSEF